MEKKKRTLEIEDISDEATHSIVLDFKQAFEQLINNPIFDISRIDEFHSKTWDDDLCKIQLNDLKQKVELNPRKSMDNHLAITKYLKYCAYKKHKKEKTFYYTWDELPIGDYYILSDDSYYTIDLSSDIGSFGYNESFFRKKYNCGANLFFCSIQKYNGKICNNNVKMDRELSFIYDADNKKVVDLLNLSIYFENSKEMYYLTKQCINSEWNLKKRKK